jgi:hypothetical protein
MDGLDDFVIVVGVVSSVILNLVHITTKLDVVIFVVVHIFLYKSSSAVWSFEVFACLGSSLACLELVCLFFLISLFYPSLSLVTLPGSL